MPSSSCSVPIRSSSSRAAVETWRTCSRASSPASVRSARLLAAPRVAELLRLLARLGSQLPAAVSAASMMRWTCDEAAAATGWAPGRFMPSTSSAISRRCASTAAGS